MEFTSLLPQNATRLEKALEETIFSTTNLPVEITSVWNIDKITGDLLTYLAWGLGVELWQDSGVLNDDKKKKLINDYISVRKSRGTRGAIKRVYEALGVDVNDPSKFEVIENDDGPCTFRIKLTGQELSEALAVEARRLTDLLKPVRTRATIEIKTGVEAALGMSSLTNVTRFVDIRGDV